MKKIFLFAVLIIAYYNANAQNKTKIVAPVKKTITAKKIAVAPIFKSTLDSASYALGINVANSFKSGGLKNLNYELFNQGLKDAFAQANPTLNPQQCQQVITKLFESFNAEREKIDQEKYAPNLKKGADFLTQNKAKSGIKTTESGLQFEVITEGTGTKPIATSQVTVHYKGSLIDGFEFDSSYKRGEPATFGLNQVISGWTEGLQLMTEGAKYRFFLPYKLAYGSKGSPDGSIPPFSTLIFEVELIKVNN